MGKVPSYVWVIVAGLAVFVAYKRGLFGSVYTPTQPADQKSPTPPPSVGAQAGDIVNNLINGIFGVARNLTAPDTNVPRL